MPKAGKIKIFFTFLAAFLTTILLAFYILSLFYYKASENSISGFKNTMKGLSA
jgi:hypothetical protein